MTFGAGLGFLSQLDVGEDELEYGRRDVVVPCISIVIGIGYWPG